MIGSGNLISQDQECKVIALSQDPIYLEVYYDQNCNQYFRLQEEFIAEVYIKGTDNINLPKMRGITVSCHDGFVSISGLDNNESVSFYTVDGKVLGTQKAIDGRVNYAVGTVQKIIIVRIGDSSIKITNQ